MRTISLNLKIDVLFHEYASEKINKKAESLIRKYIKETMRNELSYIPIYAEKDKNGAFIEDESSKTSIKVLT